MKQIIYLLLGIICLVGCNSYPEQPIESDKLPDIVPDYVG